LALQKDNTKSDDGMLVKVNHTQHIINHQLYSSGSIIYLACNRCKIMCCIKLHCFLWISDV